jgi:hypothetical protein
MKTTIKISREYEPVFLDVARRIAKGDPPQWLLIGLNHFGGSIGSDTSELRDQLKKTVEQMRDAAGVLLRWLPIYQNLGFGIQCPDDVTVVLDALPRIMKDLERLNQERSGRRPNARREICAAVIVEASKLLHGKAEHRSLSLQLACNDYWRACGGEPIGEIEDPENWRRPIKRALVADHAWIRSVLQELVQKPH